MTYLNNPTLRLLQHNPQAMKNLGPDSVDNVTSSYALVSGSVYTYTWNVTFSAALGDVPEMTIGPADADLSSVGADVNIATIQVYRMTPR